MPTIPKAFERGNSTQFALALEREARQHSTLDEALATLKRGIPLEVLPDRLLFALAPHVDISRFIHAWVGDQRGAVEPVEPQS